MKTNNTAIKAEDVVNTSTEEVVPQEVQEVNPQTQSAEKDLISSRFAALSRKERLTKQKEREIQQKESKIKELEEWHNTYETQVKADPLKFLARYGLSFQDLAEKALVTGEAPNPLVERVQQAEQRVEEVLKLLKEKEEEGFTEKKQSALYQVNDFISKNADKYEHVFAEEAGDVVLNVIQQHIENYGVPLSLEEAADLTEKFFDAQTEKYRKIKKFAAVSAPPKSPEAVQSLPVRNNTSPSTISGSVLSAPAQRETREMTDKERLAESFRVFQQGLKKAS